MTNDEAINRAIRAQQIIDDPLMVEARAHIEDECYRLFKALAPTDVEGMTQVKAMHYFHEKYRAFLNKCINDGKMARAEIERKKKPGLLDRFRN